MKFKVVAFLFFPKKYQELALNLQQSNRYNYLFLEQMKDALDLNPNDHMHSFLPHGGARLFM